MAPRILLSAASLALVGLLLSCRSSEMLPFAPSPIEWKAQPLAGCNGLQYTLVPNEYFGSFWQSNGGTLVNAIDEIAKEEWQLDGSYIMEWAGMDNHWAHFGFTNISNPHPSAVVSDLTLRFFVEDTGFFSMDVELWLNGSLARTAWSPGYGSGMREVEVPFINLGSLASLNTLEVKFRSVENIQVHSLNAEVFAYVPNPNCPDPHQE